VNRFLTLGLVLPLAAALSCAGGAWKTALQEDSLAGYHRFLRDHPNSSHADDAKQHIAFQKVLKTPTLASLTAFEKKYPESALLDRVRELLEGQSLTAARASGTAAAYQRFLTDFPDTAFAARAAGNIAYLEARHFVGEPAKLREFAARHPESDYAPEVRRSVEGVALHEQQRFERVGLVVELAPGTPEPDRLIRAFTDRAVLNYASSAVELVPADLSEGASAPDVRLLIRHRQDVMGTNVERGELLPGVVGRTHVTLQQRGVDAPIWSREFSVRISPREHLDGTSVLFAPAAKRFWSDFFVPIASWPSNVSVRAPVALPKKAVAVDTVADRAVVLFDDGDFKVFALSDPNAPLLLAEYVGPQDLQRFDGVRLLANGVAVYGEDGLEIIEFSSEGPRNVLALGRGDVGSIFAVEPMGDDLLLAGSQGLFLVPLNGAKHRRILRRFVLGLAVVGDALIFSDGESIIVSTLAMLQSNRVHAQLRIGKEFAPRRIRAFGNEAVVIGKTAVLLIDLRDPRKPRVKSRIRFDDSGPVYDVTRAGDRLFLIGDRGLQAMDRNLRSVAEAIDVQARYRVASIGRHVVVVGDQWLQVVDATPYIGTRRTAAASHDVEPAQPSASAPN
jgi:hypothetical protein